MKLVHFFFIITLLISCKNNKNNSNSITVEKVTASTEKKDSIEEQIDSSNLPIVKTLFGDAISFNPKSKDSLLLLNKYQFSVSEKKNPIRMNFQKCIPFLDQEKIEKGLNPGDSIEWYEDKLLHKHVFYVQDNHVLVFDLMRVNTVKECSDINNPGFMIDVIRIFEKEEYIKNQ